ncbi:26381_t:CDS:2, partial [Dentiscutata erythropus]
QMRKNILKEPLLNTYWDVTNQQEQLDFTPTQETSNQLCKNTTKQNKVLLNNKYKKSKKTGVKQSSRIGRLGYGEYKIVVAGKLSKKNDRWA